MREETRPRSVPLVARIGRVEDAIYLAVAVLLILAAVSPLAVASWDFLRGLVTEGVGRRALLMIGSLLLVQIRVELLYTARISLQAHGLRPEPFLIVGLGAEPRDGVDHDEGVGDEAPDCGIGLELFELDHTTRPPGRPGRGRRGGPRPGRPARRRARPGSLDGPGPGPGASRGAARRARP